MFYLRSKFVPRSKHTPSRFDIILTVLHDKLHNKTKEIHFLEFYSDNILYMFRHSQAIHLQEALLPYIQVMVCIMHSCVLAATTIELELVQ